MRHLPDDVYQHGEEVFIGRMKRVLEMQNTRMNIITAFNNRRGAMRSQSELDSFFAATLIQIRELRKEELRLYKEAFEQFPQTLKHLLPK